MRESTIQNNNVTWARKTYKGKLIVRKYSQGSARFPTGDPDVVYWPIRPLVPFLIEYKAKGGKLTPKQKVLIAEYIALGYHVHVVNDSAEGREIIRKEMAGEVRSTPVPEGCDLILRRPRLRRLAA